MKLRDLNITEKTVFNTFSSHIENPAAIEDHRRIECLLSEGLNVSEVIAEVGSDLRSRVNNVYRGSSKGPRALVAANYLTDLGLLPFNIKNTRLELFNILSCFTYWAGNRSVAKKVSNSNRIYARDDFEEELTRKMIEGLGGYSS